MSLSGIVKIYSNIYIIRDIYYIIQVESCSSKSYFFVLNGLIRYSISEFTDVVLHSPITSEDIRLVMYFFEIK